MGKHRWEYGVSFAYCNICGIWEGLLRSVNPHYYIIKDGHLHEITLSDAQRDNFKCPGKDPKWKNLDNLANSEPIKFYL